MPDGHESADRNGINLLGQWIGYPTGWASSLAVLGVCISLCFLAYMISTTPAAQFGAVKSLWAPVETTPDGKTKVDIKTQRFEFWTPSVTTKDYIRDADGQIPERNKWEALDSEKSVQDFGTVLEARPGVQGYRRYEVFGQGRTHYKTGWWWVMRVDAGYKLDDFIQTYREFWHVKDSVFVEVIGNESQYK